MKTSQKVPHSEELAERKSDHILLASRAKTNSHLVDSRFNYEPMFFTHPKSEDKWEAKFLGFDFDYPFWISSMTGGTAHALNINQNLAKLCGEFKLGMGLGSCRPLLSSHARMSEFAVKKFMGQAPLFANLGIAQIEELSNFDSVHEMVKAIEADGLIIHVNPLQEWFQPEGDRFKVAPIETLKRFLDTTSYKVIVKEVGQGMGPKSLKALLELPIAGIELAGFGGTNFTLLEDMRSEVQEVRKPFIQVGHTALEMVEILNALPMRNKEVIISGGITTMLDGFYLKSTLKVPALIGQAQAYLEPAIASYETLREFFLKQREALLTCRNLLDSKETK